MTTDEVRPLRSLVDFEAGHDHLASLGFSPADPSAARTLTAADIRRFNRDGFLAPLPAFTPWEARDLRRYIDSLVDAVVSAPDRRNSYSISSYHVVCERLYDLITTPVLLDYVEDLLGSDLVCWGMHLFAKHPGDPMAVPLHQDAVYWPLTPARSVSVWLAIDDVDAENAAMQFVPGSHALGPLPHESKALDGSRVLKRQVLDPGSYRERFTDTLRAGEVSIHSDLLLHGSEAQPIRPPSGRTHHPLHRRRRGLCRRVGTLEERERPLPGNHPRLLAPLAPARGRTPRAHGLGVG